RQWNLPAALPARSPALRPRQCEHPHRGPGACDLAHRSGRAAGRWTAPCGGQRGPRSGHHRLPAGSRRARFLGGDRKGRVPRVRAGCQRGRGEDPAVPATRADAGGGVPRLDLAKVAGSPGERARAQPERGGRIRHPGGVRRARGAASSSNGADDDGSGAVAVVELAEAFATALERPKRSLVFMTVSGEERGLWGSAYFAEHPTVPLASVVADLNSDMVGRNAKDTLAVIGREHSNLGGALDSVARAHPELNLKPVGDLWPQEGLYYRSDHYNFAKKGVPILFFTTGLHPDYHQVSDSPDKIDAEKEARF